MDAAEISGAGPEADDSCLRSVSTSRGTAVHPYVSIAGLGVLLAIVLVFVRVGRPRQ